MSKSSAKTSSALESEKRATDIPKTYFQRNNTIDNVSDSAPTTEEEVEFEYPEGIGLFFVILALALATFLMALDSVSLVALHQGVN